MHVYKWIFFSLGCSSANLLTDFPIFSLVSEETVWPFAHFLEQYVLKGIFIFLLNFNVFGIKYFDQYYLLTETSNGIPYLIIKEDNWGIELENSNDDFDDVLDIPRIYLEFFVSIASTSNDCVILPRPLL